MTRNEYNGWTNYETWVVNLWMDNNPGAQDYWRGEAETILHESRGEPDAIGDLSLLLQEQHTEALPTLTGFAADLLNAAMSEVNWREIAENLIDAAKENHAQTVAE